MRRSGRDGVLRLRAAYLLCLRDDGQVPGVLHDERWVELGQAMNKDQRRDVRDLLDLEDGLTAWEMEFIESLDRDRWDGDLTEKQENCLQRIVDRKL